MFEIQTLETISSQIISLCIDRWVAPRNNECGESWQAANYRVKALLINWQPGTQVADLYLTLVAITHGTYQQLTKEAQTYYLV